MTSMNKGIDAIIREVSAQDAMERTPQLWAQLKSLPEDDVLSQSKYIELLCHTARRILMKIEDVGFKRETWKSYTDFFTQAIVAYGTMDMTSYLKIAERLLKAVIGFPSAAQPLLKEYLSCAVAQSTQRNKEIAIYLAKNPGGTLAQLERPPDLEYDDEFVACIVAKPVSEAMKLLECLPVQLSFAHRHAIMHLRLCNPLPIPGCAFVSTGYCCDTCHLRGIRVGFQAMLYDDELESQGGSSSVRSDAQISKKKTYGFDICMACAVTFYDQQRDHLYGLLRSPHKSFSFGHVAGVRISQARWSTRRRVLRSTPSSSPGYPLSRELSLGDTQPRKLPLPSSSVQESSLHGRTLSLSLTPSKGPEGDFAIRVTTSDSSCSSSTSSRASAAEGKSRAACAGAPAVREVQRPPPLHPPSRSMHSSRGAPTPPSTRCETQEVHSISVTVTIAPYGARPIAWILGRPEKFVQISQLEELLCRRLGSESHWRSRVSVASAAAMRRRRVSAATQAANGQFSAGVSASSSPAPGSPLRLALASSPLPPPPACEGETPRDLMRTLSPNQAREGLPGVSVEEAEAAAADTAVCSSAAGDDESCAICLCPFEGEEPCIETQCHHWFHVSCIEEYTRIAEDVCPLCRTTGVLPDMSRSTALKNNTFRLELELTEEQSQRSYLDVCVGAVITRDGNYRNATSIAAAQCVRVYPNQLRGYQVSSPLTAAHRAAATFD